MSHLSDAYVVSRTAREVLRRCPFCGELISDPPWTSGNFIVHIGTPLPVHRTKKEWADYVTAVNRA